MAIESAPNYNFMDQIPAGMAMSGEDAETQANMVHSVVIDDHDLYLRWHLVPKSRPYVAPAEMKTQYVEIPGSDFDLDYTESMTGKIQYKPRTGSWEFMMIPDGDSPLMKYKDIQMYLDGRVRFAILRDYPTFAYKGRFWVSGVKSENMWSSITINYKVDPWAYDSQSKSLLYNIF